MLSSVRALNLPNIADLTYAVSASKKLDHYEEYLDCVSDLVDSPIVKEMGRFEQHNGVSTLEHCKVVSYYCYLLCDKLGLDARSGARAGMLHDLYLYDWHAQRRTNLKIEHTLEHPIFACNHAENHFDLNDTEREMILMHMWPVVFGTPRHAETYCLAMVDKYCACIEGVGAYHMLERRRYEKIGSAWVRKHPRATAPCPHTV